VDVSGQPVVDVVGVVVVVEVLAVVVVVDEVVNTGFSAVPEL
jgi:hypothetical protein